jgi:hypothetical protein
MAAGNLCRTATVLLPITQRKRTGDELTVTSRGNPKAPAFDGEMRVDWMRRPHLGWPSQDSRTATTTHWCFFCRHRIRSAARSRIAPVAICESLSRSGVGADARLHELPMKTYDPPIPKYRRPSAASLATKPTALPVTSRGNMRASLSWCDMFICCDQRRCRACPRAEEVQEEPQTAKARRRYAIGYRPG